MSRTLVRQALFQLSQNRLVRLEPARALCSGPSADEAAPGVRRAPHARVRNGARLHAPGHPAKLRALREHVACEKQAVAQGDAPERTELLGDFHVRMAELDGQPGAGADVGDLISRSRSSR